MRFLAVAILVTSVSCAAGSVTLAQQSTSQTGEPRMGPQLRVPSFLRNPLDRHSGQQPLRGFTPAHLKNGASTPRKAPVPTVAPVSHTESVLVQPGEAFELPPGTERVERGPAISATESHIIPDGESVIVDGSPIDINFDVTGETFVGNGSACGGDACGGCTSCCIQLPQICLPRFSLENLSFFAGVQGYKGPVNRGEDGSFGFSQGFNWGTPITGGGLNLGAQFGMRAVQSNFHGSEFTSENRNQLYLTAGLFRRADCGLQFGGVIVFQHDDWYAESDLAQFRAEVSWLNGGASEIGFLIAGGGEAEAGTATLFNDQNAVFSVNESRDTTEYFAFFYRHTLACDAGDWRILGGFDHDSGGLIGADANININQCWALQSNFTYLIPEENNAAGGNLDEAWNVGINLVFQPWGGGRRTGNYYRPLFNVADNGSFLVDVE